MIAIQNPMRRAALLITDVLVDEQSHPVEELLTDLRAFPDLDGMVHAGPGESQHGRLDAYMRMSKVPVHHVYVVYTLMKPA